MRLAKLLRGVEVRSATAHGDLQISEIVYDSRAVKPGTLFVAIRGEKTDGNQFVSDVVGRGAAAILSEQSNPASLPAGVAWVQVADARKALAISAANYYRTSRGNSEARWRNGNERKNHHFLFGGFDTARGGLRSRAAGHDRLPTGARIRPAPNTTPESLDLQKYLAEIVRAGGTHAVLEASSHALAMDRLWGCPFAVAIFTNLTRDHLDYHKTLEDYFAAKRRLFEGTGAAAPTRRD